MNDMEIIPNNCVSQLNIPGRIENARSVDYSPALGLYAALDRDLGRLFVWDPASGNMVADDLAPFSASEKRFEPYYEPVDMMFVSDNQIAVTYSPGLLEEHAGMGGCLKIVTLLKDRKKKCGYRVLCQKFKNDCAKFSMRCPAGLALTYDKSLLVSDLNSGNVVKVCLDRGSQNLKPLSSTKIIQDDVHYPGLPLSICCGPSQVFIGTSFNGLMGGTLSEHGCTGVCDKALAKDQFYIKRYNLDGKDYKVSSIHGMAYDGQNVILATNGHVVSLETLTDGTKAHLIAPCISDDILRQSPIRPKHYGELIVCEEKALKIYQYRSSPMVLQDMCRQIIRRSMAVHLREKVTQLPVSPVIKDYLLYK